MGMICVMCQRNLLPEEIGCTGVCRDCWPKCVEDHERRMVEIKKRMQEMKEPMCMLKRDVEGLPKEVELS